MSRAEWFVMNGRKYLQAQLSLTGNSPHDMKADYNPVVAMTDSQDHEDYREQLTHKSLVIISNHLQVYDQIWKNLSTIHLDFCLSCRNIKRTLTTVI